MEKNQNESEKQNQPDEISSVSNENEAQKTKNKKSTKNIVFIIIAILVALVLILTGIFFVIGHGKKNSKNLALIFSEDKLIPVKVDDLYGYISPKDGSMVINPKFTAANSFYGNFASVSYLEDGETKYGIIDKNGNIKYSADSSYDIAVLSEYGIFIINDVLYNSNFKPLTDENTEVSYENLGYSSYMKKDNNGKYIECGIINPNGKKVYSYKFKDSEDYFSCSIGDNSEALKENYAAININDEKYAIINLENGKVVYDFTDKYIYASDDNIFEIYSEDGASIDSIVCILNNKIAYQTSDNVQISYYDYDKKIIEIEKYSDDYYDEDTQIEETTDESYEDDTMETTEEETENNNDDGTENEAEAETVAITPNESNDETIDSSEAEDDLSDDTTDYYQVDYSNNYSYYSLIENKILDEAPDEFYHDTFESLTGYYYFYENDNYGIKKNNKQILACEYDDIEFLPITTFTYLKDTKHIEYVLAEKDNNYHLINLKNSNVIASFNTSSVNTYSTSTFIKGKLRDTNEYFVYNLSSGKSMNFDSNSTVSVYSNYIIVSKDGNQTYYNTDFNEIYKK